MKVVFGIIILLIILGALFLGELFGFGSTSYTEINSNISNNTTLSSDEPVEKIVSISNNTTLSSDEPVFVRI